VKKTQTHKRDIFSNKKGDEPMINVTDLQTELIYDYYNELENTKKKDLERFRFDWYFVRSAPMAAMLANLPGLKFMISTDSPTNIEKIINKSLLFADHIIIRHHSLLPLDMRRVVFAGFPHKEPLAWIEKNKNKLDKISVVPHFNSVPEVRDIYKFWEWSRSKSGRQYIENGLVTYAPFLPPEKVELISSRFDGVNVNNGFIEANILPNVSSPINEKVAKALWSIPFPYLNGVNPQDIIKIKEDYKDSFDLFKKHILLAIKDVDKCQNSDKFSKQVKIIYNEIIKSGISEVDKSISKLKKMAYFKTTGVSIEFFLASFGFYIGLPPFIDVAAFGKACWDLAEAITEFHKEKATIKEKPMYVFTKLRELKKK
jgi:hypothetical protein